MPHRLLLCTLILCTPLVWGQGPNPERGESLYRHHCNECHESLVHIRDRPKVRSLDDLRGQVGRWAEEVNMQWGNEEIEDVMTYLNATYYHLSR